MKILHVCPTFSSPNCGIGRYTNHLTTSIKRVDPEVVQTVLEGFASIHHVLLNTKPDVCHIQLEYGFCSPQRLTLIDEYCYSHRIKLFITFHTLACVPHNIAAPHALKLAHTPLAKNYGQFEVIPSGIPNSFTSDCTEPISDQEIQFLHREPKPYLFFGQAHSHKQLWETLQLFNKTSNHDKHLVCIVSKPIQGDTSYYDKCKRLADSSPNICWIQEYLGDEEVLLVSKLCQAALFPYIEYGSIGISAAVKLLLNNLDLPIYTTFASHFSDIPDNLLVINKYPYLEDMIDIDLQHDRAIRETWVHQNSFDEVAKIHLQLYR